jgi:hypothetical protein
MSRARRREEDWHSGPVEHELSLHLERAHELAERLKRSNDAAEQEIERAREIVERLRAQVRDPTE